MDNQDQKNPLQKLQVLVLSSDKIEAFKLKKRLADPQFQKVHTLDFSQVKEKINRGAHSIVALITDQAQIETAQSVLEKYHKYEIRIIIAKPDINLTELEESGWKIFLQDDISEAKAYIKDTFNALIL